MRTSPHSWSPSASLAAARPRARRAARARLPVGCAAAGAASEAVTATGRFGAEPTVELPDAGLTTKGTQVSILSRARAADRRRQPRAHRVHARRRHHRQGRADQRLHRQDAPRSPQRSSDARRPRSTPCSARHVGDRLAVALPQSALATPRCAGTASKKTEDAVVAVIDVKRAFDSRANGTPQLAGRRDARGRARAGRRARHHDPGVDTPPTRDETHLLARAPARSLTAKDDRGHRVHGRDLGPTDAPGRRLELDRRHRRADRPARQGPGAGRRPERHRRTAASATRCSPSCTSRASLTRTCIDVLGVAFDPGRLDA